MGALRAIEGFEKDSAKLAKETKDVWFDYSALSLGWPESPRFCATRYPIRVVISALNEMAQEAKGGGGETKTRYGVLSDAISYLDTLMGIWREGWENEHGEEPKR